jgi:tellurite methyltransferase
MGKTGQSSNAYDDRYSQPGWYWGKKVSALCFKVLELMPPEKPLTLLDIGCGEGQNAVFFARNGYRVTAFDLAQTGVEKTLCLAAEAGVKITAFQADINTYRLREPFDIIFSTGVLHYIPDALRREIFDHYKAFTNENGLNVFSVLVNKPFIPKAPDADATAHTWLSGEVMTYYHDWKIEYSLEHIFDCMSSGVPHQHASNKLVVRKITGLLNGK